MKTYDAITKQGEHRPTPLPGTLPCVCDNGGGGWLHGKYVGPVAWKRGWTPDRHAGGIDSKSATAYWRNVARACPDALAMVNVYEDQEGLDNRVHPQDRVDFNIGQTSIMLQAARSAGLSVGNFCFPVHPFGGGSIPAWHAANDQYNAIRVGKRNYESRAVLKHATHLMPAWYAATFNEAADFAWLAEAFRVARTGGVDRPVVPVISAYNHDGSEIPVDVQRARLTNWRAWGVAGVIVWSDRGATEHNRRTVDAILSI